MFRNKLHSVLNFMAIMLLLAIVSCSSDKGPPRVAYKPGGIVISYKAVDNLNSYDQTSHSVVLAIYQVDNINAFHGLAGNVTGIQKLLSFSKFDPSVLGIDKRFIYASESGVVTLDRLENTRWVGIVAGYYNPLPTQVVKEFEIPKNTSDTLYIDLKLNTNTLQEVSDE